MQSLSPLVSGELSLACSDVRINWDSRCLSMSPASILSTLVSSWEGSGGTALVLLGQPVQMFSTKARDPVELDFKFG